jgi:hypothetical protein
LRRKKRRRRRKQKKGSINTNIYKHIHTHTHIHTHKSCCFAVESNGKVYSYASWKFKTGRGAMKNR